MLALYFVKDSTMKLFLLAIIFLIITTHGNTTEFKLRQLQYYGSSPGIELSMRPSNANTLNEIFRVINLPSDEFYIRLIGRSSDKTNSEIILYYREYMPKELDVALKSSGHWRDSAVPPLAKEFHKALKSTTIYLELESELSKRGYKINNIDFEKFHIRQNSIISVPDVYIRCIKGC